MNPDAYPFRDFHHFSDLYFGSRQERRKAQARMKRKGHKVWRGAKHTAQPSKKQPTDSRKRRKRSSLSSLWRKNG